MQETDVDASSPHALELQNSATPSSPPERADLSPSSSPSSSSSSSYELVEMLKQPISTCTPVNTVDMLPNSGSPATETCSRCKPKPLPCIESRAPANPSRQFLLCATSATKDLLTTQAGCSQGFRCTLACQCFTARCGHATMLWGVPKAQQQPFSSMAVAAQVWQWFGETGQEGL